MYLLKDFKSEMTMPMHTATLLSQQHQRRTASRSTNPNRHVRDVQWITSSGTKPTPITRGTTSRENRFVQLYDDVKNGNTTKSTIMGPITMAFETTNTDSASALACSTLQQKPSTGMTNALLQPDFLTTSAKVLRHQAPQAWAPGTQDMKLRSTSLFTFFLAAVGLPEMLHAEPGLPKSRKQQLQEEDLLCHFSLYRMMCGQSSQSFLEYVSHIPTAYAMWWRTSKFGLVGGHARGQQSNC